MDTNLKLSNVSMLYISSVGRGLPDINHGAIAAKPIDAESKQLPRHHSFLCETGVSGPGYKSEATYIREEPIILTHQLPQGLTSHKTLPGQSPWLQTMHRINKVSSNIRDSSLRTLQEIVMDEGNHGDANQLDKRRLRRSRSFIPVRAAFYQLEDLHLEILRVVVYKDMECIGNA